VYQDIHSLGFEANLQYSFLSLVHVTAQRQMLTPRRFEKYLDKNS